MASITKRLAIFGLHLALFQVIPCTSTMRCMPISTGIGRYQIESTGSDNIWVEGISSGSTVRVSIACNSPYSSQPTITARCVNGTWTEPWPVCLRPERPCNLPQSGFLVHQFVNDHEAVEISRYSDSPVPDGTVLTARCKDPGKSRLLGDARRQCVNGQWTNGDQVCEYVGTRILFYGVPRQVAMNGTVVVYPYPKPRRPNLLYVDCNVRRGVARLETTHIPPSRFSEKYQLRRTTTQRMRLSSPQRQLSGTFQCTSNGMSETHSVEVIFNELECPPPLIDNGRIHDTSGWRPGRYPITKQISFSCDEDYRLVGSSINKCVLGEWSYPIPRCEVNRCPEITAPAHGRMYGVLSTGRNIGDERIFHCDRGYVLRGYTNLVTCITGGVWSHDRPTCEPAVGRPVSPCDSVQCESWEKCVVSEQMTTRCSCINPFACPASGPPVCGTDGYSYISRCHLKATACLLNVDVDIADDEGICNGGLPRAKYSSDTESGEFQSSFSYSDMDRRGDAPSFDPEHKPIGDIPDEEISSLQLEESLNFDPQPNLINGTSFPLISTNETIYSSSDSFSSS